MKSKEEFYEVTVKNIREILEDENNLHCTCPKTQCEWHGDCQKCVAVHRYYKDHIPNCLQQFVNDKIKAIAQIGELEVVEKEKTPSAYWEYVQEQDKKRK
ncbi:MAG: hypothetical protein KAQ68_01060 [Clostridiales bacterium]|nr:hypothetical protein [Clostridiales bacterium]